jgi:arylsulfatase
MIPAQPFVGRLLETFKEFPPRQKAASFTVGEVMEKIAASIGST